MPPFQGQQCRSLRISVQGRGGLSGHDRDAAERPETERGFGRVAALHQEAQGGEEGAHDGPALLWQGTD